MLLMPTLVSQPHWLGWYFTILLKMIYTLVFAIKIYIRLWWISNAMSGTWEVLVNPHVSMRPVPSLSLPSTCMFQNWICWNGKKKRNTCEQRFISNLNTIRQVPYEGFSSCRYMLLYQMWQSSQSNIDPNKLSLIAMPRFCLPAMLNVSVELYR